jgi:hypothetical protein
MGARAEFAPPLAGNSAEALLGAERARLERAFDAQWRARVAESWRQVHEKHQRLIEEQGAQSQMGAPGQPQTAAAAQPVSGPVQLQDH